MLGSCQPLLDVLKALPGAGFSSFTRLHSALLSQESYHLLAFGVLTAVLGTVRLFLAKLQMAVYHRQAHFKKDTFLTLLGDKSITESSLILWLSVFLPPSHCALLPLGAGVNCFVDLSVGTGL